MDNPSFPERERLLDQPHICALSVFRTRLLSTLSPDAFVPNFDPLDGGVNAEVLFLLETPGRVPRTTRFTSLDNPSGTSKNLRELAQEVGLSRKSVLMWNLVPWDINDASSVKATSVSDRAIGTSALLDLLRLLPSLRVVVFFGQNAGEAAPSVANARSSLHLILSPHPSPQNLNSRPHARGEIRAALKRALLEIE